MTSNDANAGEERLAYRIEHMQHLVHDMDVRVLQSDVHAAASLRGKPLPEGSSCGAEFIRAIHAKRPPKNALCRHRRRKMRRCGGEIFVFPHLLILPNLGNVMIYRVRPNGDSPDSCIFEIFSTTTYPKQVEISRAEVQHVTEYNDPQQVLLIPRQDFANVPRMQRGLHASGCRHISLAKHPAVRMLNRHLELDRYPGVPAASAC